MGFIISVQRYKKNLTYANKNANKVKIVNSTLQHKEKSHKNSLTYCIFQLNVYFIIIWYSFEDIPIKKMPLFERGTPLFINVIVCKYIVPTFKQSARYLNQWSASSIANSHPSTCPWQAHPLASKVHRTLAPTHHYHARSVPKSSNWGTLQTRWNTLCH